MVSSITMETCEITGHEVLDTISKTITHCDVIHLCQTHHTGSTVIGQLKRVGFSLE